MKVCETWIYSGIRYIAVPNGNGGSSVLAQTGEHYGSWMDVKAFRKRQANGEDAALVLGRAELRVAHVSNIK